MERRFIIRERSGECGKERARGLGGLYIACCQAFLLPHFVDINECILERDIRACCLWNTFCLNETILQAMSRSNLDNKPEMHPSTPIIHY